MFVIFQDNKKFMIPWLIATFLGMVIITVYIGPFKLWHMGQEGKVVFISYLCKFISNITITIQYVHTSTNIYENIIKGIETSDF